MELPMRTERLHFPFFAFVSPSSYAASVNQVCAVSRFCYFGAYHHHQCPSFHLLERPDREIANELGLLGLDMPGQNVDLIRTLLSVVCGREFNFSPDLRDSFLRFLRRGLLTLVV